MDWIDRDLCVGKPCEIVLKVQTELINVDLKILNDLLPDASIQVKRRRLKYIEALSEKMLEWELNLAPLPKGPPPTLADFRRVRQAWLDNLEPRYFCRVRCCEHLTPGQQAQVFVKTPEFPEGIDPNGLFSSADEPCIEHIKILRALSRLLSRGMATYEEQFADE